MKRDNENIVRCDTCEKALYSLGKAAPRTTPDGECIAPVAFNVAQRWLLTFCTRACALKWLENAPEEQLRGGYPIF